MTLDSCGKPQVIAGGLTLLITDGLPMRKDLRCMSPEVARLRCRPHRAMSAFRCNSEDICSH
jgi:hypothetical protein